MQAGANVNKDIDKVSDAAALRRWHASRAQLQEPPWLHTEVAKRMAERLVLFRQQPKRVLQWWPVASSESSALQAAYPDAELTHVRPQQVELPTPDASPSWWRSLFAPRSAARVIDDQSVPARSCDMLWANMALHAAADRHSMIKAWREALTVNGVVMFSTLGPDTTRELRSLYRSQGWGPHAAPLADMHDIGDDLVHAGFADPVMDQETLTLHWADVPSMLQELRTLGRNTAPQRFAGLRTPRWRHRLADEMQRVSLMQARVSLTFEVVYGHAFRVDKGQSTIELDALRGTLPSKRLPGR